MQYLKLNNGVKMPILGFGTEKIPADETRHAAARADEVKARIDILIAYAELLLSIGESPTIDETALR